MSNFKTHATAGLIAGSVIGLASGYLSGIPGVGVLFGVSTFTGSLAPDIDTGSVPSRIFAWIGIVSAAILMYNGMNQEAAIVGIVYMAFSSDKHRGFTHSYLFAAVCFAIGALGILLKIPSYFSLLAPFSFGLIVHYMLDR